MAKTRASWRRLALAAIAALPALVLGLWLVSRLGAGILSGEIEARPAPPPALQAGAAATPAVAAGLAGLALLVAAMGPRFLGPIFAVVTAIAVLQAAGIAGTDVIRAIFATGLGLAAINARPIVRMPRAVAILVAVAGGLMVAFSDMTWLAAALLLAGRYVADALFGVVTGISADLATAMLALIAAVGFLGRAAARARGPAGVALSFAVGYFALAAGLYVLDVFYAYAAGAMAYLALLVAAVAALIDLFAALERGDIASLVWAGPLAVLAKAIGFAVGPAIAAIAAIAAIIAAFTLRDVYANTAVMLAFAALAAT